VRRTLGHHLRLKPCLLAAALFGAALLGVPTGAGALAAEPDGATIEPSGAAPLARSLGDVARVSTPGGLRRAPSTTSVDTITVFHADLEGLSSPSNEGGFTHVDQSGTPTAWHIAPTVTCVGNSFWCGVIDSSWTGDPNFRGYANGWVQTLSNFADLSGAVSPYKISFQHQLDIEQGFDFAAIDVFDLEEGWVRIGAYTGKVPQGGGPVCNLATITIPDSIVAASPTVIFRFVLQSDVQGSSADGLYPGEGWAIDDVTVFGALGDIRFFDDFEAGMGTWTVSTFPPVGDFWRITAAPPSQQLCTTNTSKVWNPTSPVSGALVPRVNDLLISPPVFVNGAGQVFFSFDVYRDLSLSACFYYEVQFRSRETGLPWSGWSNSTGLLYFGNEREWLRQTVPLPSAAGAESVQTRIAIKDYADLYCDGVSTSVGTALYLDNLDIRVIGQTNPSVTATDATLFQDTFRTTAFYGNDNLNAARGDTVAVRIGASRGLKTAFLHYSLNGAAFAAAPLTAVGTAVPGVYFGDVPAGAYPRGTQLRYYFAATDSLDETATLPPDAIGASHYFTASVLPAIHAPTSLCTDDSARVLYVNAFAGFDAVTGVDQSLAALGFRYDRYDVNAPGSGFGNTPGGGDPGDTGPIWPAVSAAGLGSYRVIVWDVGERAAGTLSAEDESLLQAWLALPGKNRGLILAGDNLAYDLAVNGQGLPGFLACAAGAAYVRDIWENSPQDSLLPAPKGASGTRIAGDSFGLNGDCPGVNRFDGLNTATCAGGTSRPWLLWPNGLVAGTERLAALPSAGDSAKTVLLGFSLSTIPSAARRNLLLWRTVFEEMEVTYCSTPTSVETSGGSSPPVARLLAPAPNPFNPSTAVRFSLTRAARVRLAVYSASGARVRVLADRPFGPGEHRVDWDGRDDRGHEVGSAAYLIQFQAEGRSEARKVVLLR